jgi:hypothetical protein
VRFFAHDGKTVHGPSEVAELTRLPGFDGDTLVCPVGSENSADWKPALAYPPFREILLAPPPKAAPPPPPPPPAPTIPCPRCAHRNPERAVFCNACGARMDGREEPKIPAPEPEPVPAEPVPAPAAGSPSRRGILIASFAAALAVSGGLGWWLLHRAAPAAEPIPTPPPAPAVAPAAVSTATAPAAAPAPLPPPPAPVVVPPPAPAPAAKPAAPEKPARKRAPKKAARAKKAKTAAAPPPAEPEPLKAPDAEPAKPAAEPADEGMMLPGVPRRLPVVKKTAKPDDAAAAPGAEPGAAPAAEKTPESSEDGTTRQVREQVEFCSQLLAQGAYEDHFDTCLCAEAKQAAPYRGRRGVYAASLKKRAPAGMAQASAQIAGIVMEGGVAKVAAAGEAQTWRLEDGLWCRAP